MKRIVFLILVFSLSWSTNAQVYIDNTNDDESDLYAETKQINQFLRRFNAEEDKKGKRLYEKDRKYRDPKLRQNYLENIFDLETSTVSSALREEFINEMNSETDGQFLDFYKGDWYAELDASFDYKGRETNLIMYMKIEKDRLGYKWVISNIYFRKFEELFFPDTAGTKAPHFIHPMSHEINFMTLKKVFDRTSDLEYYSEKEFTPDQLTLFLYEIKNGNLKYNVVRNVKFHFLQLDGWYFEVKYFNRVGHNKGWLISNLLRVNETDKSSFKF